MHWTRKTTYAILTAFILIYFFYFYIENIFLPLQFKRFIITKAQEFLQRRVSLEEIHFSLLRGFIIHNLTVFQKDDSSRVFVRADEISCQALLIPVFQQKLIFVPSMRISGPFIQIVREAPNQWNFSDLFTPLPTGPVPPQNMPGQTKKPAKNSWQIVPRKIIIQDGEITYTDQTTSESFQELINDIYLDTRISLNKIIRFILKAKIPRREATISVKGNYAIDKRELSSRISAQNIPLAAYAALFPLSPSAKAPANTTMHKGELTSLDITLNQTAKHIQILGNLLLDKTLIDVGPDNQIAATIKVTNLSLERQADHWHVNGHLELPETKVSKAGNRLFQGSITADIESLEASTKGLGGKMNLTIRDIFLSLGGTQNLRAQTAEVKDLMLRQNNNALHLQAALNLDGLQAVFAEHSGLKGRLVTRQTKIVFEPRQWVFLTDMQLTNGRLDWGQDRFLQSDLNTQRTIVTGHEGRVKIKSDVQLPQALLQLDPQLKFVGSPHGTLAYRYDPRQDRHHSYAGDLNLAEATLQGLPYVDTLTNIHGNVRFNTDTLSIKQVFFQTQGMDIMLSGSLTDFLNPVLNIQAKTNNLDLQKLFATLTVLTEKIPLRPIGTAELEASYHGTLQDPATADIKAIIRLEEAAIASTKLAQGVTSVSGEISYQKDLVTWKDLQGLYQSRRYTLNGQLANFSRPTLDLRVVSDELDVTTQIKILNNAFQIVTLTGKYLNSSLDAKGDVRGILDGEPDWDLRGTFALNLEDLAMILPAHQKTLKQLQLIGTLTGDGLFQGKPSQWRDWNLTFTASAPTVSIRGFHIDDLVIQEEERDRNISKLNLQGNLYNGELKIVSSTDLTADNIMTQFSGSMVDVDLAQLRTNDLIKNKFLAGKLSGSLNLNGDIRIPMQWKGDGVFTVTDGHIWQWGILEGLWGALLVPEFQNVVFTSAQAHFTVADGKTVTKDASLDSKAISIKGEGWIDFNQNIHFDITPIFSELTAIESKSLKKATSLLLTQTQDYLNIRLTGTLRRPHYKVQVLPVKVLEKTIDTLKEGTEILKEGVGAILKEIF